MSYQSSNLHVSEFVGIGPSGRCYSGGDEAGIILLDHSCSDWVIGTPIEAKQLLYDLVAAIFQAEDIRRDGPKDPVLVKAIQHDWMYYCHLCGIGFKVFQGSTEHGETVHGQKFGREYDHKLAGSMNYSIAKK